MELRVTLAGDDEQDLESLIGWLRRERIPSMLVEAAPNEIPAGQMGSISDALLVTVTPEAIAALAGALAVWLRTRRTEIRLTVRRGERETTLDAKGLKDSEAVIREVLAESEVE